MSGHPGRYVAYRPIAALGVLMASKTTITLEDDLEGGPAEETVRFRLGSVDYEIDLNTRNADRFRSLMTPFVDHARKVGRGESARPVRRMADRRRSAEVRAWARDHGIAINERGRIPTSVIEQYEAATQR
jgi:hypothetical protein